MTQRELTRRQIVQLLGTAVIGSTAGCTAIEQFGQQETEPPNPSPKTNPSSSTSVRERTQTATSPTRTSERPTTQATTPESSTDPPTPETPSETIQTTNPSSEPKTDPTATDTPSEPGYKGYHWHGRLFFEINGDLVDFSQPIYYLKNLQQKRPETVYFHFHDSAHAPNEWSNEKKTITFARGLDLLPTIEYARQGGSTMITYKGRTYRASRPGTSIDIYRGTDPINPTTYTVQHGDNFWVRIGTRGSRATASGTRTGKLLVDINNRRLTFTSKRDRRAGTNRFEFRRDGNPYTWYSNGQPVTLAEALNTLPEITYERGRGGASVITYTTNDAYGGTYHETSNATTILTRQRWNDVDPQSYELQDGDLLWVYVETSQAPSNEH
jgi:hypothetical protein